MARKTTRPNEANTTETHFDWQTFISNICKGEYVLIIGSEIVLDKNQNVEARGDSSTYLLQSLIEELQDKKVMHSAFQCDSFADFSLLYANPKKLLLDNLRDYTEFDVSEVNPDLVKLIDSKCFRVVLTTTIDPYVEKVMHKVWGDVKVMDIYNAPDSDFDFSGNESKGREYYSIPPTLYYVFGKAGENHPDKDFVLSDNDTIRCIAKWMGESAPKRFMQHVKTKKLLALGCKFDDWCFRFLWHAMRQDTRITDGDIAVTLDVAKSDIDRKLHHYLSGHNIHVETDAHAFLSKLVEHLDEENRLRTIRDLARMGGVFLSYASEDFSTAHQIFNHLREKGLLVWMDKYDLRGGDVYDRRIQDAINQCRVFVPVLSCNVRKHLVAGIRGRYYMKEWKWASGENAQRAIMPIRTLGYDDKGEYHKYAVEIMPKIKDVHIFDWQSEPFDGFIQDVIVKMQEQP